MKKSGSFNLKVRTGGKRAILELEMPDEDVVPDIEIVGADIPPLDMNKLIIDVLDKCSVHEERLPMNASAMRVMVSGIQSRLGLPGGKDGWSSEAMQSLLELCAKPPRKRKKKAVSV